MSCFRAWIPGVLWSLGYLGLVGCGEAEAPPLKKVPAEAVTGSKADEAPRDSTPPKRPVVTAPRGALLFDELEAASRADWLEITGASREEGPANVVTWREGHLEFRGERETKVWKALSREVEVGEATWVELQTRARTEAVTPMVGGFDNCNAYVKHGAGLVATRVLMGTLPWTDSKRLIELPPGTKSVTVGLFCSMPGTASFERVVLVAAEPPAWSEEVSGKYSYRTLPGDRIDEASRSYNEASFTLVAEFFGIEPSAAVEYRKYPDVQTKEALSGQGGNAHREGPVIHTIWSTDRHEIVHVLGDSTGDPPALIAEGLAVHLSGSWQSRAVRDVAAEIVSAGTWPGLSTILGSRGFRAHSDLVTYPASGAFVAWMLETKGKDTVLEAYRQLKNNEPEPESRKKLEALLGTTLEQADADLRSWLASVG